MHTQGTDESNKLTTVEGDLLDQHVDAIVNPWNRNLIPWWLLIPQGVSGAIKRRAGLEPFQELRRLGPIPLGGAVVTSAGRLPYKAIIHVAGINLLWRASEDSIRKATTSALNVAERESLHTLAIPAIGAGSGGFNERRSMELIADEVKRYGASIAVTLVRFRRSLP